MPNVFSQLPSVQVPLCNTGITGIVSERPAILTRPEEGEILDTGIRDHEGEIWRGELGEKGRWGPGNLCRWVWIRGEEGEIG